MSPTPAPPQHDDDGSQLPAMPAFLQPPSPPSQRQRQPSPRSTNPNESTAQTATSPVSPEELAEFEAAASAWDGAGMPEPETFTPASTDDGAKLLDPNARKLYESAVKRGAIIASSFVDARMSPDSHAFMMREDEADDVAAPASRLLARHVPLGAGMSGKATDLSDFIELVTALVGYVMGSMHRRASDLVAHAPEYVPPPARTVEETPAPVPSAPVPAWPMPAPAPALS